MKSDKPEIINVPLPLNIKSSEHYRFLPYNQYEREQISVLNLKNVCITRAGIVTKNLNLVKESVYSYEDRHSKYWKSAMFNFFFRKWEILSRSKKYTIAQNYYCPGYYHWITEALPRLLALGEKSQELILLIPDYADPDIDRTLEIFNFKAIRRIKERTSLLVAQLVMPSHPKCGDTYDPKLLQKLRKEYSDYVKKNLKSEISFGPKIYVSRKKARARKVSNEFEVMEFLSSKGFVEICFEDFTFFEKVSIMASATHLISIHGAGLTNMLFMPEEGNVLEFYRDFVSEDEYHSKSYWRMAGALGLNYSYQLCLTEDIPKSLDKDDLVVEIPELEQNLKIMGL